MSATSRFLEITLRGFSKTLMAAAALLFFLGGRAIHEFLHVERLLAEGEGLGLCVVSGLLSFLAGHAAERYSMRQKASTST
ncbi:MAG TPA: hypothetical protein VHX60_13455 [Acidobacteriaceae bacterium]|jgi:hypothetical protein|nr:hypothetical protein [Acidobacteriaceae bacterium]